MRLSQRITTNAAQVSCYGEQHYINNEKTTIMNHPLLLTKKDREEIILKVAEILAEKITFDPEELMVILTATVAQCTGLSPRQVQRKFPITEISKQKQGVILSTLKKYIEDHTRPPSA